MSADVAIARRDGHAVVLDACGQPHTAAQLAATIHVLEGRTAAAPERERAFWRAALIWRQAVYAALTAAEAGDVAVGE